MSPSSPALLQLCYSFVTIVVRLLQPLQHIYSTTEQKAKSQDSNEICQGHHLKALSRLCSKVTLHLKNYLLYMGVSPSITWVLGVKQGLFLQSHTLIILKPKCVSAPQDQDLPWYLLVPGSHYQQISFHSDLSPFVSDRYEIN